MKSCRGAVVGSIGENWKLVRRHCGALLFWFAFVGIVCLEHNHDLCWRLLVIGVAPYL